MSISKTFSTKTSITASLVMSGLLLAISSSVQAQPNIQSNDKADLTVKQMATYPLGITSGGVTVLNARDALNSKGGQCLFDLFYSIENKGKVKSSPFSYKLKNNGVIVNQHHNIVLQANASEDYYKVVGLKAGINTLQIDVDTGNQVNESNESNNSLTKRYKVVGNCGGSRSLKTLSLTPTKPVKTRPTSPQAIKKMKPLPTAKQAKKSCGKYDPNSARLPNADCSKRKSKLKIINPFK